MNRERDLSHLFSFDSLIKILFSQSASFRCLQDVFRKENATSIGERLTARRRLGRFCRTDSRLWRGFYLLQPEQLLEEQLPQDELAVLLNFPPLEKAKVDILRLTFLALHLGQPIFSEELRTNFSNSCSHWPQTNS